MEASQHSNPLRRLPSVESLLQDMPGLIDHWGREQVTAQVRMQLAQLRQALQGGGTAEPDATTIIDRVQQALEQANTASLKPVLNLTGTVLHTNLGRAVLPQEAIAAVVTAAAGASNLEFTLDSGERGDRDSHIEALVCELTGAEAATAVNNNAAAVLLVLNTLAMGREVPVSRGELVEIGGSFRIPEVMQRSNCSLVEVGATNRTHLKDYRNAINERTALLMKVHTSNFRVEGFTHSVSEAELAALAHEHELPFVIDLGSGSLVDFSQLGLPDEPTAAQAIAQGADIITFSGDKLLGGPQSGLIAGRADLIKQIKQNPLKRALRLDKMTLAAMAEVLKLYRDPHSLVEKLPTLRYLTRPPQALRELAVGLLPGVQKHLTSVYDVGVSDCHSQIGSGALPVETIPSVGLRICARDGEDETLRHLVKCLRNLPVPVIGRLHQSALWLDLRCLERGQDLLDTMEHLQL